MNISGSKTNYHQAITNRIRTREPWSIEWYSSCSNLFIKFIPLWVLRICYSPAPQFSHSFGPPKPNLAVVNHGSKARGIFTIKKVGVSLNVYILCRMARLVWNMYVRGGKYVKGIFLIPCKAGLPCIEPVIHQIMWTKVCISDIFMDCRSFCTLKCVGTCKAKPRVYRARPAQLLLKPVIC